MTHRENSLTPWITNKTHGAKYPAPLILSPSVYAAAERAGFDMRYYVSNKPMPDEARVWPGGSGSGSKADTSLINYLTPPEARLGTRKNINGYPGARGRKHLDERQCGGKDLGCLYSQGRCVACPRDD